MKKIVVSALYYPMGMYRYFLSALQRREDVEIFTVGPAFGNWIPWNGGMYLPPKYVCTPRMSLPKNLPTADIKIIEKQLPWEPDVWLQVDAGFHLTGKPQHGLNVHVLTDPHCLQPHYKKAKPYMDVVFGMQMPYLNPGEVYLPYGFDPTVHYPTETDTLYDACLIGLHYEQRDRLVNRLKARRLSVYYDLGPIFDEYRDLTNQSRIALSWSSLLDLPARVWEAMGMNVPLVTNRVPDLSNFFVEGDHYLGFSNEEEGANQVQKILNDYPMALEMSANAHRKVMAGHTWDHRIQQIFDHLKMGDL